MLPQLVRTMEETSRFLKVGDDQSALESDFKIFRQWAFYEELDHEQLQQAQAGMTEGNLFFKAIDTHPVGKLLHERVATKLNTFEKDKGTLLLLTDLVGRIIAQTHVPVFSTENMIPLHSVLLEAASVQTEASF